VIKWQLECAQRSTCLPVKGCHFSNHFSSSPRIRLPTAKLGTLKRLRMVRLHWVEPLPSLCRRVGCGQRFRLQRVMRSWLATGSSEPTRRDSRWRRLPVSFSLPPVETGRAERCQADLSALAQRPGDRSSGCRRPLTAKRASHFQGLLRQHQSSKLRKPWIQPAQLQRPSIASNLGVQERQLGPVFVTGPLQTRPLFKAKRSLGKAFAKRGSSQPPAEACSTPKLGRRQRTSGGTSGHQGRHVAAVPLWRTAFTALAKRPPRSCQSLSEDCGLLPNPLSSLSSYFPCRVCGDAGSECVWEAHTHPLGLCERLGLKQIARQGLCFDAGRHGMIITSFSLLTPRGNLGLLSRLRGRRHGPEANRPRAGRAVVLADESPAWPC